MILIKYLFFAQGFPCVCFNRRWISYEVIFVSREHFVWPDDPQVQLVVLYRLFQQQISLRLKSTSIKKLSAYEIDFILQQKLQKLL